jgi:hypothetical protein
MSLELACTRFWAFVALLAVALVLSLDAQADGYDFQDTMPRPVLENYLDRAMTNMGLLTGRGDVDDNTRMLIETGVKFAGRVIYRWGGEAALPSLLKSGMANAEKVHRADPDIILQAGAFEIVSTQVNQLPIPAKIFALFDLPPEERNFRYEGMIYPEGHRVDHWGKGASVPDMSRLETRLWFAYLAAVYIDVGCEAIHFGQVEIMDDRDPEHVHWREMLRKARQYARQHARRGMVLCDAHVPSGGIVHEGKLLFDFHSFPLRIKEVPEQPQHGFLQVGHMDSIYQRSAGGMSPSGWACDHLPYLVELDNYGVGKHPGKPGSKWYCWGYDEISWFARQPADYRNQWLRDTWQWLRDNDPNGFLQMPGSRVLHAPVDGKNWYFNNTPSAATPQGFGQEATIKAVWAADGDQ